MELGQELNPLLPARTAPVTPASPSHGEYESSKEEVSRPSSSNGSTPEEELECRVCRGEAEEDRPLFAPCYCSGSIKYIHQDCLVQWLDHCGKDYCELCGHKFRFTPLYAKDAPARLPAHEVVLTVCLLVVRRWIPFLFRVIFITFLWSTVAPWVTSWLYRMWMLRTGSSKKNMVMERFNQADIWQDVLAGLIVSICVIFSFLALMLFADFLRFHWDELVNDDGVLGRRNLAARERDRVVRRDAAPLNVPVRREDAPPEPAAAEGLRDEAEPMEEPPAQWHEEDWERMGGEDQEPAAPMLNGALAPAVDFDQAPERQAIEERHWEEEEEDVEVDEEPLINERAAPPPRPRGEEEELEHMELNIALDELLGFRGPLTNAVRNLTWLLAFNGAYLGLFVFIPFIIGKNILGASNNLLLSVGRMLPESEAVKVIVRASHEAAERGDTLQSADVLTTFVGYSVIAASFLICQALVSKLSSSFRLPMVDGLRWTLDCVAAVIKVTILLLLKMLFLPVLLGFGIDLATLALFHASSLERVAFTANNVVGSLLIHWVLGISGMLVVTVSVLQLREVLHPYFLSTLIRPQEAHPDLLKSLLAESFPKHTRRMLLSLTVYFLLLVLLIYLPVRMATAAFPSAFPLEVDLSYFVPELQLVAELVACHMVVLGLLERFKNVIGDAQHHWLVLVCGVLGLSEFILPLTPAPNGEEGNRTIGRPVPPPPLRLAPAPGGAEAGIRRQPGVRRSPWPEDPEEPLEVELCPRRTPERYGLRLSVLFFLAWLTLVSIILLFTAAPYALGKSIIHLVQVPKGIRHDPFSYVLGCVILCTFFSLGHFAWLAIQKHLSNTEGSSRPSAADVWRLAAALLLWLFVCPLAAGLLFDIVLMASTETWLSRLSIKAWLIGVGLLETWSYLVCTGILHFHVGEDEDDDDDDEEQHENDDLGDPELLLAQAAPEEQRRVQEARREAAAAGRPPPRFHIQVVEQEEVRRTPLTCALAKIYEDILTAIREESWRPINARFVLEKLTIPLSLRLWSVVILPEFLVSVVPTIQALWMTPDPSLGFLCYRTAIIALVLSSVLSFLMEPLSVWLTYLHDSVRNDRFLIGRQLHDRERAEQQQEAMQVG